MGVRKEQFVTGEIYHCYNRGVDKRNVFLQEDHFDYFTKICHLFNKAESLGGVKEYNLKKNQQIESEQIVTVLAYCFNPNHYHLLLRQEVDDGITKFMQKIGTGYTMYFNKDQDRTGSLFQGKFKSKYVDTDEYLKHLCVYVNKNNEAHNIFNKTQFRSSHRLYVTGTKDNICDPREVVKLYGGSYETFSNEAVAIIRQNKDTGKDIEFNS